MCKLNLCNFASERINEARFSSRDTCKCIALVCIIYSGGFIREVMYLCNKPNKIY